MPLLSFGIKALLGGVLSRFRRARITHATGSLDFGKGPVTFVLGVGSSFDQERLDAMMSCRIGYCNGFEQLGVPYLIVDVREIADVVDDVPNPICMLFGGDMHLMSWECIRRLRDRHCLVWLYPWFKNSDRFFEQKGLNPATWHLPSRVKKKILSVQPDFGFTATVPSGLGFFEEWEKHGVHVRSLPLACDTRVYGRDAPDYPEFADVQLAFVGGYWQSKGQQLDRYLRPFEDRLTIYGYNVWPYSGYRGRLTREMEASFYRQARLSPAINEPTVAILKGQINERAFKVMGSFGCTVVDAVPAYRELYSEDELLIAENTDHFYEVVLALLRDDDLNHQYRIRGYEATLRQHTYRHRAREILRHLGIAVSADQSERIFLRS